MNVVIIGAGGHGKVVLDILQTAGRVRCVGFLDADPQSAGTRVCGIEVLGPVNHLMTLRRRGIRGAIVAIGDSRVRGAYLREIEAARLEPINAVHPSAVIALSATLGRNVTICAGAVVCAEAKLGDGVIVNTCAVVDHECELRSAVHVCPGALLAGRVRVEEQAMIGMGAKVLPCRTVGARAVVGAGAVVTRDVSPGTTVVGVPARSVVGSGLLGAA